MIKKICFVLLILFLVGCTKQELVEQKVQEKVEEEVTNMKLTSSAFENSEEIPSKYTCDGENINPPLFISEVPEDARSLALIMDDPDIPNEVKESRGIQVFDHWVLFNIPPETETINEGSVPEGALQGSNSAGNSQHIGPCPPPQYEPKEHRYFFKLYALDVVLNLPEGSSKSEVEQAIEGHVLEETELMGKYQRK